MCNGAASFVPRREPFLSSTLNANAYASRVTAACPSDMNSTNHLRGARIYLSGPMDFVASRAEEKTTGWRNRVGDFLRSFGSVVFDPWFKPAVRGLHQYGLEDVNTIDVRSAR